MKYTAYKQFMAQTLDADGDIETWITVKGNHIPIMKGQSKEEAVKAFIEKKSGNTEKEPQKQKTVETKQKQPVEKQKVNGEELIKAAENIYGPNSEEARKTREMYGKREGGMSSIGKITKNMVKEIGENRVPDKKSDDIYAPFEEIDFTSLSEKSRDEIRNMYLKSKSMYGPDNDLTKRWEQKVEQVEISESYLPSKKEQEAKKSEQTKNEFEEAFGNSSWRVHKDWVSYSGEDYRIEITKVDGLYRVGVYEIDTDDEEDEMAFGSLENAKKYAEEQKKEYIDGPTDEEKTEKVRQLRRMVGGSMRFEKKGRRFIMTGLYSGGEVELDFEKLTGQNPDQSVEYHFEGNVLHIDDYRGKWHKEIDFSEIDDADLAEMIIK